MRGGGTVGLFLRVPFRKRFANAQGITSSANDDNDGQLTCDWHPNPPDASKTRASTLKETLVRFIARALRAPWGSIRLRGSADDAVSETGIDSSSLASEARASYSRDFAECTPRVKSCLGRVESIAGGPESVSSHAYEMRISAWETVEPGYDQARCCLIGDEICQPELNNAACGYDNKEG